MKPIPRPDTECSSHSHDPRAGHIVRQGSYFRRSDGQRIQRYQCRICGVRFSSATRSECYRQKKRQLNHELMLLICSGVSQRRAAKLLKVSRKTIARKFRFLAERARRQQAAWLKSLPPESITYVQFDDLETFEHTKCKPLSVALAVEPSERKILAYSVSQMPAKGKIAEIARKKYGPRKDQRAKGWDSMFSELVSRVHPEAVWRSDQNPHYPKALQKHFPRSKHETVLSRRGCIVGQGELKKIGFDPLFSLNHTCAMLRANMNRLFRRTWCTTKKVSGLEDHLSLYVAYHNQVLTSDLRADVVLGTERKSEAR